MSGARRDWLADAEGTARRLAAESGLSRDGSVYGEICVTCDARWALPADQATCPHQPICEDCYPNGCESCEWQEHETLAHREQATSRILKATLEVQSSVEDLSDSDLRALGWLARKDILRDVDRTIYVLRRVRDVLREVERKATL